MEAGTKTKQARYGNGTICKYIIGSGVRYRAWVYLGVLPTGRRNRPSRTFATLKDAQMWVRKINAEACAEIFSRIPGIRGA